jgi:protein-S-isoprenylcysteine O-methyltransferase Ste14
MALDELTLRRVLVSLSAVVYLGGVYLQARRIRKRIGRSPNLKPRTSKERLLWAGWFWVIVVWLGQPFLISAGSNAPAPWRLWPALLSSWTLWTGTALLIIGYACTLWCYAIMGNAWRIGINQKEKNALITAGPYGVVRHPIYLFQIVMLAGALLLLPTTLSFGILIVHIVCVMIKGMDEEAYLVTVHGDPYRDYLSRTGRLFPKLF